MGNDLISIIVPVYNVEDYLDRCVESIINQTYKNIEIILVDDGSKDNSGKIADSYFEKDSRICVYHKKNGGLSDARNYGLTKATGKYVSFIDSDDYIDARFIEVLYNTLTSYNCEIAAIGLKKVTEHDETLNVEYLEPATVFDKKTAIENLFSSTGVGNYAWNKLYKIDLFDDIRYPLGKKMEDIGTTYLLFLKCNIVAYNQSQLYYYYQRNDSIIHQADSKVFIDCYVLTKERYFYLKNIYPEMMVIYDNYFKVALSSYKYLDSNERKAAKSEMLEILKNKKVHCTIKEKLKLFVLVFGGRFIR